MMLMTHDSSDYWLATIIIALIVQMPDSAFHRIKDYPADKNMYLGKPIICCAIHWIEIYLVDSVIKLFNKQALQIVSELLRIVLLKCS